MTTLYISDTDGTLFNYAGKLKSRAAIMLARLKNKGVLIETLNCENKAAAALELKRLYGANRLVCFGNGADDIPMFKIADECYAVANACEDLKAAATGIIPSNEEMGVLTFIEQRECERFYYIKPELRVKPDADRFAAAVKTTVKNGGIGELNEKAIHAALKAYFSSEFDREAKIGGFYADAAGENGVIEIQTSNWDRLNKKLGVFLDVCHVTAVYPFERRVHTAKSVRNNRNFTEFMRELYRIRGFLTDKNLTVCIAALEIKKDGKVKTPLSLTEEIYLCGKDDYRVFLPENLPPVFTRQEFIKFSGHCDGSILLEILEYMSVVRKAGKHGRGFLYETTGEN